MNKNLQSAFDRAQELLIELGNEYTEGREKDEISLRAMELTHEVLIKYRSILDRTARVYWEQRISTDLSEEDRNEAKVYFPICKKENDLDSELGRWLLKRTRQCQQQDYGMFIPKMKLMTCLRSGSTSFIRI